MDEVLFVLVVCWHPTCTQQGSNALMLACGSGNLELVQWLVEEKFMDPINDRNDVRRRAKLY